MFLIKEKRKNGTNLCIVQSYWDPVTKKSKTKRIMNVGYLEDLQKEYDDPIAHFSEVAKKMTEEYKARKNPIHIELNLAKRLTSGDDLAKNFGYVALSSLYHELKLHAFFHGRQRTLNLDYDLNSVMKLLVYGHILFPGSEKQIYEKKERFFDKMNFSLDDIYRTYSCLALYKSQLQTWLHEHIMENYGRNTSKMYYYVTHHYFERDGQQKTKKAGRSDPITQLGLFVDQHRLPVAYELFPKVSLGLEGENDLFTLKPTLKKTLWDSNIDQIIIVADNAINNADILYRVLSNGNGYILSPSVRNVREDIRRYVLNDEGYVPFGEECRVKSRVRSREILVTLPGGRMKSVAITERQIVLHNGIYERWARAEREDVLLKAKDILAFPGKYQQKKRGEILQNRLPLFDGEKLKDEEQYDGYYLFLTSELDMDVANVIRVYNNLWEIEDAFKNIDETYLAKPSFISCSEYTQAHFLICFVSLILTRLLEEKTGGQYSLHQILRSLKKCNCMHIEGNNYVQGYYDSILELIGKSTGIDFSKRYRTLSDIKNDLSTMKK